MEAPAGAGIRVPNYPPKFKNDLACLTGRCTSIVLKPFADWAPASDQHAHRQFLIQGKRNVLSTSPSWLQGIEDRLQDTAQDCCERSLTSGSGHKQKTDGG